MDVFPQYPGKIVRFDYDAGARSLRAYYRDGSITLCDAVPPSLIRKLIETLTPEEFFCLYISSQYECETVAPRARQESGDGCGVTRRSAHEPALSTQI